MQSLPEQLTKLSAFHVPAKMSAAPRQTAYGRIRHAVQADMNAIFSASGKSSASADPTSELSSLTNCQTHAFELSLAPSYHDIMSDDRFEKNASELLRGDVYTKTILQIDHPKALCTARPF